MSEQTKNQTAEEIVSESLEQNPPSEAMAMFRELKGVFAEGVRLGQQTAQTVTPQTPIQPKPDSPTPGASPLPIADRLATGLPIDPSTLAREDVERLQRNGQFFSVLEKWRRDGSYERPRPFSGRKNR